MRSIRIGFVWMIVGGIAAIAAPARADGGAYIDLDRTHYLPGQTATATAYVSVPASKRHLLEEGPFYAFLVTGGRLPAEGRPIPADDMRIGAFEVEHRRGSTFELRSRLSIPQVPGDLYSIGFCNDPCTIAGFREPITGLVSIVQTRREARLLDERQRLMARVSGLRRQLHRGERDLQALRAEFDARERDRAYLAEEVNRLNHRLATSESGTSRPLVDAGTGLALAASLAIAGLALALTLVLRGRRRPRPLVPDTVEGLRA
jgi:hypothetical protein